VRLPWGAVPLTFPAHQLPVLPLKIWRPQWFDATALCIGAAAPDLGNPLGEWMYHQSHTAIGLLVWAVPFTLVACWAVRWRGAASLGAHLPDGSVFRLRSYRVVGTRRPRFFVMLTSALIGAGSHVFIDGFTHAGRWGANWANLNTVLATLPVRGDLTVARLLQFLGHTVGSLAAIGVFAAIGQRRLLERWYGQTSVEAARRVEVIPRQRVAFWSTVVAPPVGTLAWCAARGRNPIFATLLALAVSMVVAGCVVGPHGTRDGSA
jgi:hypothetical protein